MKIVLACCAVLVWLGSDPVVHAQARGGLSFFDEVAPRPPRPILHVRPFDQATAMVPLPRRRPAEVNAQPSPPSGPVTFPPVAPLE